MPVLSRMLLLSFSLLLFSSTTQYAQSAENSWKTLSKLTYKMEYDDLMGFDVEVPVFSKEIKNLEGKEITIEGYIIPLDGYDIKTNFIFSAYPYNMCFFCGGAGRETVMEVLTSDKKIKFTSKPVTIRGRLELNSTDVNKLMFILHDAVLVSDNIK